MLERLDYVKIAPRRILDAGSGPAREAAALRKRYPKAQLIALDFSLALLPKKRWLRRTPQSICADFTRMPIAAGIRSKSPGILWSWPVIAPSASPASRSPALEIVSAAKP